ncbi:hypothetical protein TrispH2_009656 [Trichoplax sp. H2]|nr:hypothetical protein TrispH2_009656 [Trichoplax sp. H2]|eukprot:RDD38483.1 hypothetical protein TrispH2_009656 [Trichoplax sp. H2]
MSYYHMRLLSQQQEIIHWRMIYNLDKMNMTVDYYDYPRSRFSLFNFLRERSISIACKRVDYANIHESGCSKCSMAFAQNNGYNLVAEPYVRLKCGVRCKDSTAGSPAIEKTVLGTIILLIHHFGASIARHLLQVFGLVGKFESNM